jgi:uncharacterized protein (TIGR02266 family)
LAVYGLAILWPAGSPAEKASELVGSLKSAFPAEKVELIQVARLSDSANVHIRLNLSPYPRPLVEKLMREVKSAEGRFVELWRMSKDERDSFRSLHLPAKDDSEKVKDFDAAAKEVRSHLTRLPKSAAPAGRSGSQKAIVLAPEPLPAPVKPSALAPAPPPAEEKPLMEFPEELDYPVESPAPAPAATPNRKWERIPCRLEVEFKTDYDFVLEHATNICNGGLFVKTQDRPELHSEVSIKLKLPDGQKLETRARVAHIKDDEADGGVGIEFLREDEAFARTVDAYLASLK